MALGLWPSCTYIREHTSTPTLTTLSPPRPHFASFSQWVGHKKQRQVFNFVARSWQTEKYKQKAARQAIRERGGRGGSGKRNRGPADDSERQHINKMKNLLPAKCSWVQKASWLTGCTWPHLVTSAPPPRTFHKCACVCVCTSII